MLKDTLGETKAGMQILQMKYQEEFNNLGISYELILILLAGVWYKGKNSSGVSFSGCLTHEYKQCIGGVEQCSTVSPYY